MAKNQIDVEQTAKKINDQFKNVLTKKLDKFGEYDTCLYKGVLDDLSILGDRIKMHIVGHSFCEIMEGKEPYSPEKVTSETLDAAEIIILNYALGLLLERNYPELEIYAERIINKLEKK